MEAGPKVSVIIPVYNAENYLQQCLDSVANQTLQDIEIICVNDGSTDRSLEILRSFEKKDNRFIILTQENQGAAVARNEGLSIAKGEFISVLDADDFFDPNMLKAAYNRLVETNSEIAIFKVQLYDDSTGEYSKCTWAIRDNLLPKKKIFSSEDVKEYIFQFCNGWAWDKMFRREYIEKNRLRFQNTRIFNDARFVFLSLAFAQRISIISEVYATKRRSVTTSISSTRTKNWKEFSKVIYELEESLKTQNVFEKYQRSFLNYALHLALFVYRTIEKDAQIEMFSFLENEYLPKYKFNSYSEEYYYNREEYRLLQILFPDVTKNVESVVKQNKVISRYIEETIPVVYAMDDGYARYTATSIDSIMRCSPIQQKYTFYILTPPSISNGVRDIFLHLESIYQNCTIQIIPIGHDFSNAHLQIQHITIPTYYRLLLPDILPDIKKCIYLDGDTIVCQPLTELYERDLGENYIAGVEAYGYYRDAEHHRKRLNLSSFGPYVNAGVLLMNLDQMRKDDCVSQFMSLMDYKFSSQDQDILNVACYGRIQCLPYKYNVMTAHQNLSQQFLNQYISQTDLDAARKNPVIIHYATKEKPWNTLQTPMSVNWWRVVLEGTTWPLYSVDKTSLLLETLYNVGDRKELNWKNSKIRSLEREITNIHNSWTYKIGRFITWAPRMLRGAVWCYQEHGLSYTVHRILVHLHLVNEIEQHQKVSKPVNNTSATPKRDYDYYRNLQPEQYADELKFWFKKTTGTELNLDNPKTYNEKIQWLKLYDSTPLKTRLADKYLVRDWVKEKIGNQYLIPLLGVWDKFEDIDFNKLPNSFVLKANHGCGWNIIVKDKSKFNFEEAKKKFDTWMNLNFAFRVGLELQYMNIPPKIIAEEYMENGNNDLYDYKVFCFNGKAESIMFLSERKHGLKMAFHDLNWNKLPFVYTYPRNEAEVPKPKNLELLIQLSEKLAAGFAHVRVDFYILNDGSLKFGEMTFTSASGNCKWNPPEQNRIYGDLIKLPQKSPIPERKVF